MTDVELPQLSLQRYLDLVKRRRWQLVPVSLLGLVVGGLVAFFIPRYYVADTLLEHQLPPGAAVSERDEDPFRGVVDSAKTTIPLAVRETLVALKVPEAMTTDLYEQSQVVKGFEAEVDVRDGNNEKGRQHATIRVTYRDRDGARCAKFLNTLVTVWKEKVIRELRERVQAAEKVARDKENTQNGLYESLLSDKAALERMHKVQPDLGPQVQESQMRLREAARDARRADLREKQVRSQVLEATLAKLKQDLEATPERVAPDSATMEASVKDNVEAAKILALVTAKQMSLGYWDEHSPEYRRLTREIARYEKLLRVMMQTETTATDGLVQNPKRAELQAAIEKAEAELAPMRITIAKLETDLLAEDQALAALADAWKQLETLRSKLEAVAADRLRAQTDRREQEEILARLNAKLPVQQVREAVTPPHPTDPNILVVALIGCVLGLGTAIGLILLLDLLQGSFKTVDDVERGLAVPVLGGMSHLETEEERRVVVRGRRRASVAAFAFVGLVVVVVTIYYVDPVRLPPIVRDLLSMLLGS